LCGLVEVPGATAKKPARRNPVGQAVHYHGNDGQRPPLRLS
jgi:hypothetical protein